MPREPALSCAERMTSPARQPRASPSPPPSGGIALGGAIAARDKGHSRSREKEEVRWDPASDANRVHIFDTTLSDGEQSPGISLNTAEKVEIAQQLARLGVDVIEAGFPITSPGDFEAVEAIARGGRGPGDLRPGPHPQGRHRRRLGSDQGRRSARASTPSSRPPTSTSSTSCRPTARTSRGRPGPRSTLAKSYCEDVEFSPMDATRADVEFTAEVCAIAVEEGATVVNIPDTVGYTTPGGVRGLLPAPLRAGAGAARGRDLGPLPRRPGPGRRQLLRRRAGRARARSSARSTGSASAPATARWRRSRC